MRIVLLILLLLAMAAVVYVLVRGVIAMASGKDMTGEQSQMWMRRRVLFQALAILIVVALLFLASGTTH
jgi:Hypoxia induced protein conserved region